jgi:hypothetical protein
MKKYLLIIPVLLFLASCTESATLTGPANKVVGTYTGNMFKDGGWAVHYNGATANVTLVDINTVNIIVTHPDTSPLILNNVKLIEEDGMINFDHAGGYVNANYINFSTGLDGFSGSK